jgi:acyl-CoA synthetase (AMP-forming)/AMP-acid ligase II
VQVFTPYGATESLPVAIIGSDEILSDTRHGTDNGLGICVGKPTVGVTVDIVEITDEPIETWAQAKFLPPGEIGEIVVRSRTVTSGYFAREAQTRAAKIRGPNGEIAHRMGDVGYFDEKGRLWYCGRKSHRVVTKDGTLFTEQVEGIFNADGDRTALVGVPMAGEVVPVICIELSPRLKRHMKSPEEMLAEYAARNPLAARVKRLLFHTGTFPVDIRHNAKIFREKLAVWAAKELA